MLLNPFGSGSRSASAWRRWAPTPLSAGCRRPSPLLPLLRFRNCPRSCCCHRRRRCRCRWWRSRCPLLPGTAGARLPGERSLRRPQRPAACSRHRAPRQRRRVGPTRRWCSGSCFTGQGASWALTQVYSKVVAGQAACVSQPVRGRMHEQRRRRPPVVLHPQQRQQRHQRRRQQRRQQLRQQRRRSGVGW